MIILRRLTGLFVALLLFQANWQERGVACVTGHAASHHEAGRSAVLSAGGVATADEATAHEATAHEATAHEATAHEATAHEATAHEGPRLRWAFGDAAGNARASSTTGPVETQPSHCPDSGMPADCAAMIACSAAAASEAAGPLLATEGRLASERVVAPDARPHSRDAAPDVPPPRA